MSEDGIMSEDGPASEQLTEDGPTVLSMIAAVAIIVAIVILIFFLIGYAFGRLFL
jgi:preprotein translocase subunit SecE